MNGGAISKKAAPVASLLRLDLFQRKNGPHQ